MVANLLDIEIEQAIDDRRLEYRDDPVGFAVNVLGMREDWIWPAMIEVAEAIRDHQKVAVRAGHFVSKTYSLGRLIVPWFKTCFTPSTVVTTAPSDNQVKNQLWREIHAAHSGSRVPLGGRMTSLMWDCKPEQAVLDSMDPEDRANWEKNFAIGFSTSADSNVEHATKMQGWHNEWVLVVIDEACGMLPQIWRTAVEGLINDERCKIVGIGNPTDPESDFAKACHSSDDELNEGKDSYISDEGWYVITIDARDNPNYQNRARIIPGLASYEWVQSIIERYGEDGDGMRYRVKGLFPTHKEGTYYGDRLAKARGEGRIGDYPHDPIYPVYTFSDFGDRWTATIFIQFRKGRIRIIGDYWDYEGAGAPAWANVLDAKKYKYMGHIAGPDLNPMSGSNRKSFATGELLKDTLLKLGYAVQPCEHHDFDSGIRAVCDIWSLFEINELECQTFLPAAGGYGKTKNMRLSTNERPVYHNQPAQTWHRHIMDALRHMAVMYRIHQYMGDTIEGLYDYQSLGVNSSPWDNNILTRGLKSFERNSKRMR
uniref:Putative terminase n=1 Tax=viral metagenome TaxID=1070528 RepID=A0A6M3KLW0_9ZZZZ